MNTKMKIFLVLALVAIVAGGVFAQRVGETVTIGGRAYTVAEVGFDGTIVLRPVAAAAPVAPVGAVGSGINGTWRGTTSGAIISISGDQAVYVQIGTHPLMVDAANKGRIAVGGIVFNRIQNRAPIQWSADIRNFNYNANSPTVNSGVGYTNTFIQVSPDGRSFTLHSSAANANNGVMLQPATSNSRIDFTYTRM